MIFEARYRVLFNTLLANEPGVEEGLVQADSPFCGTKRFGMCYVTAPAQEGGPSRMASIGTVLEIVDFAHVQDGRIFLTNKGRERFRVLSIVRERPVMMAEVEELPEEGEAGITEEAAALGREVADLLRSVIRLNIKFNSLEASEDQLEPEELSSLGTRELSYWVASFFGDIRPLQQALLEEDSTIKRLTREKEILSDTARYYSAAVAVKSLSSTAPAEETESAPSSPAASPASDSSASSPSSPSAPAAQEKAAGEDGGPKEA